MTEPVTDPDLWWISDAAAALDAQISEEQVLEKIRARLQQSNRRGVPVTTDSPGILVNTRALRLLLAASIWEIGRRDVAAIEFDTDSATLTAIDIDLIGRYGDHLAALGDRIHDGVTERLRVTLGPVAGSAVVPRLHWSDLEELNDPSRVE